MATLSTYDETATAGASSLSVSSIASSASAYTTYNITGAVVASGTVTSGTATLNSSGNWPAGWTFTSFTSTTWSGNSGYGADWLEISSLRTDSSLPPVPAVGTSPNAGDPAGAQFDNYLHGFCVFGPQRWQIYDAANPTTTGADNGANIANIQANIALDQAAGGWVNPSYADSARPHYEFIQFPNNQYTETGYAAGVTSVVQALGPGTTYGVEFFEGLNEPMGSYGLSAAQAATQYSNFQAAVHAGNANAKALAWGDVTCSPNGSNGALSPTVSSLSTYLADLTSPIDGFSCHFYNGYNGNFVATEGWFSAIWSVLNAAGYVKGTLPFFLTEIGQISSNYGIIDPRRQVEFLATLCVEAERWGCPTENIYIFYDTNTSYYNGSWQKESGSYGLRPSGVYRRVRAEELRSKTYSSALNFGTIGNNLYRGNVYTGTVGQCVELMAQGQPYDTITLALSDAGPITYSTWEGQTATVTGNAGNFVFPVSGLPIYVRLSPTCSISVVDAGNGLSGTPTNLATSATVVSGSGASGTSLVNNGIFETGGYLSGPDYMFTAMVLPDYLELDWSSAQTISKVLIVQIPPWRDFPSNNGASGANVMTAGYLQYWNGSVWLPLPTVAQNHWNGVGQFSNSTAFSQLNAGGWWTFWDRQWVHNVELSYPVSTTKLRWTVTAASWGHCPDLKAAQANTLFFADTPGIMASEIVVLPGTVPNITYAPFETA